jgi:CDP-4-dehydro-6-deoxyglucose reductase
MPLYNVILKPGAQHFMASSRQDLLQAALSAGINLRYGCSAGNCGKCIARLLQGSITQCRHSDFKLDAQQALNGSFLTCCHSARSDLELEIEAISCAEQVPEQHIRTRVYQMQALSDDVMSVTLKTPRSQHLQFLAGQYVTVDLGHGLQRNKSLANCPCDGMKPVIHVRRRAQDPFSKHVFNRLRKNDPVDIAGPWGEFTLIEDSPLPILLVAFDTGFASIKSLLDHIIALDSGVAVHLVWLSLGERPPYMENYCRSLADALDYFSFDTHPLPGDSFTHLTGALSSIFGHPQHRRSQQIFITLPHERIAATQQWLQQQELTDSRLHLDRMEWFT